MKLSFYGAAREVTGSCYCIEVNGKKVLIDCGLQQGSDEKDNQGLQFDAAEIDAVILTHAHIDHSGRLPLLVKNGFKNNIYAIEATCDLVSILLKDSAKIQEMDAKWENRKNERAGKEKIIPLYSIEDAQETLKYLVPLSYKELLEIGEGIKLRFIDAGHILGSASVELFLEEEGIEKKLVFSGDIGNLDQPIIKDPQYIEETDYVVMESTYGDRNHKFSGDQALELSKIINKTLSRGGNVIIPSFAVGRTQSLLYLIREIKKRKLIPKGFDYPVYVDSPLASEATRLYDDDLHIYGDIQTQDIVKKGRNPLNFSKLYFTESTKDSKALNYDPIPKVIISSSGMCEGGRIKHHLKHNIWKEESSVVFVGFQAEGTLGREIFSGAKRIEIYGSEIVVKAEIYNFTGLSAHADREGLIKWVKGFKKKPEKIFLSHGEDEVCDIFVETLEGLGFKASAPYYGSEYDLANGELISTIEGQEDIRALKISYKKLLDAQRRLTDTVTNMDISAGNDIDKISDEINKITKKLKNV